MSSSLLNYGPVLLVPESDSVVSLVLPGSLAVYCRRAVYSPITVHFFFEMLDCGVQALVFECVPFLPENLVPSEKLVTRGPSRG